MTAATSTAPDFSAPTSSDRAPRPARQARPEDRPRPKKPIAPRPEAPSQPRPAPVAEPAPGPPPRPRPYKPPRRTIAGRFPGAPARLQGRPKPYKPRDPGAAPARTPAASPMPRAPHETTPRGVAQGRPAQSRAAPRQEGMGEARSQPWPQDRKPPAGTARRCLETSKRVERPGAKPPPLRRAKPAQLRRGGKPGGPGGAGKPGGFGKPPRKGGSAPRNAGIDLSPPRHPPAAPAPLRPTATRMLAGPTSTCRV